MYVSDDSRPSPALLSPEYRKRAVYVSDDSRPSPARRGRGRPERLVYVSDDSRPSPAIRPRGFAHGKVYVSDDSRPSPARMARSAERIGVYVSDDSRPSPASFPSTVHGHRSVRYSAWDLVICYARLVKRVLKSFSSADHSFQSYKDLRTRASGISPSTLVAEGALIPGFSQSLGRKLYTKTSTAGRDDPSYVRTFDVGLEL